MLTEPRLTPRELDIMWLVASDLTSKEIGRLLQISPRTVEMHVRSSMRKLDCGTRAGAVWRLASLGALPGWPGPPARGTSFAPVAAPHDLLRYAPLACRDTGEIPYFPVNAR